MSNKRKLSKATDKELQYMLAHDLTITASEILREINSRKNQGANH